MSVWKDEHGFTLIELFMVMTILVILSSTAILRMNSQRIRTAAAAQRAMAGRTALLMLDGAENADDLGAVLAVRGGCGVLVTSRRRQDASAGWEDIAPLNPPSWEEFQKKPVFRFEIQDAYHPYKEDLERGEDPFKGTESGKIEFYSKVLAKGPDYLSVNEVPLGSGKCYGGGNLPPMAQMTIGGRDTFHSRDTDKYPLLMSSPHAYYRVHSFLDNNSLLRGDCYRHAVWMNVADAKVRGIRDDDLVKVYNDIGEMIIPAYVTSRVVPGTVAIHHGAWYKPSEDKSPSMPDGIDGGGAPNLLTHEEDLPDTVIGMLPCKGLVQIEKWEGA